MNNNLIRKTIAFIVLALLSCTIYIGFSISGRAFAQTSAQCMVVLERESGRVLCEKNAKMRRPMASTTKIATAITVIENTPDLDRTVIVPSQAEGVEGSSIYLKKGERLKIRDLLYGLMLQSGNDCAVALAVLTAGSVEKFAVMMNETAKKAGAYDTNFTNPHGLHNDNHYTTAYDLARISAYAMSNETFREIVATKRYECPWDGHDYNRVILNKNKILSTCEGGNGVKTGFTKKAGRCLVASANREGMDIITVVLNCGPMFEDCRALIDEAFDKYDLVDLSKACPVAEMPVSEGKEKSVELKIKSERLPYPLTEEEKGRVSYQICDIGEGVAPIKKNEERGKIRIYLEKELLFERKFYTIKEVEPLSVSDRLGQIIEKWNG